MLINAIATKKSLAVIENVLLLFDHKVHFCIVSMHALITEQDFLGIQYKRSINGCHKNGG